MSVIPFNPLDKRNLARSVINAMMRGNAASLKDLQPFDGAGIYAIYYTGDFESYEPLSKANAGESPIVPIYVGKAVPSGGRRGGIIAADHGQALFKRLSEHRKSIEAAVNLNIEDFCCRYLVVDDIWIPLGEALLISKTSPVWNSILDGFGNHDPGAGRRAGKISRWDVLHPRRPWVAASAPREETSEQLAAEIREYLENQRPFVDPTE